MRSIGSLGPKRQRRLWSDFANAQADLRWAHMPFCWFCREAAHILILYNIKLIKSSWLFLLSSILTFTWPLHYPLSWSVIWHCLSYIMVALVSCSSLDLIKANTMEILTFYDNIKLADIEVHLNLSQAIRKCLMPYANNKGADQPAHPRCLISAFAIRCQDRIIPLVYISEISTF